ncbi:hypothetical protein [Microbacterium murale]|uniref:Uncharacterized protein n=1 Tax=Microbacterium murale TaxID=1081040 RepID=A0ABU0PBT6_9MICO|nr:hypothetical protein [Microbacterium murale]MDQ0644809.1 hypothetical protein [Microbacterium murale]
MTGNVTRWRDAQVSRRALLAGAGAGVLLAAVVPDWRTGSAFAAQSSVGSSGLPPIAPLPAGAPDRRAFTLEEQRLAPYLATLAPMVNEIVDDDGAALGWMSGGWWRTPAEPFNARIQEHVRTLAWFYAHERPWNPYSGDAALLARLDAAIHHYLRLQHADGSWPEYEPDEHSRAATAFALGYLSKTLEDLRDVDALPQTRTEISGALHRAMSWFLDPGNTGVWQTERIEFVNQPMAGLAGSALALRLDPDPGLQVLLLDRIDVIVANGQSPAGYFYEPLGMDIAYNLNVTLSEMIEILEQVDAPGLVGMVERLADWLGYNLVWEPDGAGFIANTAGSARTPMWFLDATTTEPQQRDLGSRFAPDVAAMRAFYTTIEDRTVQREAWAESAEPVLPQARGQTNPRIVVNIPYGEAYPSRADKDAAIAAMPVLAQNRFTELRRDPQGQHFLFARRPGIYTMAHFGPPSTSLVRSGLSLIWHPESGTFVHGSHNSNTECWGTVLPNGGTDAGASLAVAYFEGDPADGHAVEPEQVAGVHDLGLTWRTTLGNVTGAAVLEDDAITKRLVVTSDASEQVPLLLRTTDRLTWIGGNLESAEAGVTTQAKGLKVRRGRISLEINWSERLSAAIAPVDRHYFADRSRQVHMLRIAHPPQATIRYSIG